MVEGRAMLPHVHTLRERIHAEVCERGFGRSDALDASVLRAGLQWRQNLIVNPPAKNVTSPGLKPYSANSS
jgi:hypothetical protein